MKFKLTVINMSTDAKAVKHYELPHKLNEKNQEVLENRIDALFETIEIKDGEDYGAILEVFDIEAYSADYFFHQLRLRRMMQEEYEAISDLG
jgi:RecJ-like exonuclease